MQARFAIKFIAGCGLLAVATSAFSQRIDLTDDAGNPVSLQVPARRVVALAPNLAELVYAAGAGSRLVAVSRFSDFPEDAKKLPVVSDAFAINLEALAALRPDLVLVWQSGSQGRQRQALHALAQRQGFAVFESEIPTVEAIATTLQRIGRMAGTAQTADKASEAILQDWKALQARYQTASPLRVFYQLWDAPLMTLNGKHIVSQAIRSCGGIQGFDTLSALTPTVSREAVLAFNPQLILAGGENENSAALSAWRALPGLAAVQHAQLKPANAALLSRMGPRFVKAAAALCERIDGARSANGM